MYSLKSNPFGVFSSSYSKSLICVRYKSCLGKSNLMASVVCYRFNRAVKCIVGIIDPSSLLVSVIEPWSLLWSIISIAKSIGISKPRWFLEIDRSWCASNHYKICISSLYLNCFKLQITLYHSANCLHCLLLNSCIALSFLLFWT